MIGTSRVGAERSRERVLTAAELRSIWAAVGKDDHGRIVKLLLLTGQRRGEVAAMTWSELDLDRGVWSMAAERTKNDLRHDVPLTTQAKALLAAVPHRPGRRLLFGEGDGAVLGLVTVQDAGSMDALPASAPRFGSVGRWPRASALPPTMRWRRGPCTTCAGRW